MVWEELGKAICLMLILEGMTPFVIPEKWQSWLRLMVKADPHHIRIWGGVTMLMGLGALLWFF